MKSKQPQFLTRLALVAGGILLGTVATFATAADSADAQARYKAMVDKCNSGTMQEDRPTCLREAGAALQESRRGDLHTAPTAKLDQDAVNRCSLVPQSDRDACMVRAQSAPVSGSVNGGGDLRESVQTTITVPAQN